MLLSTIFDQFSGNIINTDNILIDGGEENVGENNTSLAVISGDVDEGYISSLEDRNHPHRWLDETESFLSSSPALQDVPEQHHQAWSRHLVQ